MPETGGRAGVAAVVTATLMSTARGAASRGGGLIPASVLRRLMRVLRAPCSRSAGTSSSWKEKASKMREASSWTTRGRPVLQKKATCGSAPAASAAAAPEAASSELWHTSSRSAQRDASCTVDTSSSTAAEDDFAEDSAEVTWEVAERVAEETSGGGSRKREGLEREERVVGAAEETEAEDSAVLRLVELLSATLGAPCGSSPASSGLPAGRSNCTSATHHSFHASPLTAVAGLLPLLPPPAGFALCRGLEAGLACTGVLVAGWCAPPLADANPPSAAAQSPGHAPPPPGVTSVCVASCCAVTEDWPADLSEASGEAELASAVESAPPARISTGERSREQLRPLERLPLRHLTYLGGDMGRLIVPESS